MIRHYMYAKQVCDRLGVQIYNATVGGNLEVFPRVNYLDIFKEPVDVLELNRKNTFLTGK